MTWDQIHSVASDLADIEVFDKHNKSHIIPGTLAHRYWLSCYDIAVKALNDELREQQGVFLS